MSYCFISCVTKDDNLFYIKVKEKVTNVFSFSFSAPNAMPSWVLSTGMVNSAHVVDG